jgi:hypothetical protein
VTLDLTSSNGRRTGARAELRPARAGESRSHVRLLRTLSQLPPARQGPVLRSGRAAMVRPLASRRLQQPKPMTDRVLGGELQRRLIFTLAGVLIFIACVTALGSGVFQ